MAETTPPPSRPPSSSQRSSDIKNKQKHIDSIRLHPFSDVIFFWPICLVSAVFFIILLFPQIAGNSDFVRIFSWIWLIVFIYNVFIVAFDFPSGKIFGIVAVLVCIIMLVIMLQLFFKQ